MTNNKKPDGWIAFAHGKPLLGTMAYEEEHAQKKADDKGFLLDGEAQIKPIYLSTEPPVPRELVAWALKARVQLDEVYCTIGHGDSLADDCLALAGEFESILPAVEEKEGE